MNKTFTASVKSWSDRAKKNCRFVVMEASEGVYNAMTERQPGVKETGGSFEVGKIPVDTGFLANSVQVSVGGSVTGQGTPDFIGAISGFDVGEPIQAAFTAEYASHVEYGHGGMAGRFFVRQAINQWPAFVAAAARRYKD